MVKFSLSKNKHHGVIDTTFLAIIREHFSIANPSYNKSYTFRFAPRRIYAITASGKFDIGMYDEILKFIKQEGFDVSINNDTDFFLQYKPLYINYTIPTLKYKLRDYQHNSVTAALNHGRGVVVLPTAAGKTLTIATLICSMPNFYDKNFRCLIIVPTLQLIHQTYADFIDYNIPSMFISKWSGDDIPDLNSKIIIAGLHILQSQYENNLDYLKNINAVIIDECHKIRKGNIINNILKTIDTPNKFGFTGTMPPDMIDQWNIIGKIGPILYKEESINLRNNKQISNLIIQILIFNYYNTPIFTRSNNNPTQMYEEESNFIINSSERNDKIKTICEKTDKNTLILIERIKHGEILFECIKQTCLTKEVFFIQGSVDVEVREKIRGLMETKDNIVCIAISKVFAEGISVNNLHYIIFAASKKAKIKILQSIGRGLRLHASKKMLIVFDIADNLRYGKKHLKERIKLYESEKIQYKTVEIQI